MRSMAEIRQRIAAIEGSVHKEGPDGACGVMDCKNGVCLYFVISWGCKWDHVSVHPVMYRRTPTWEEMCDVKEMFFGDGECVMQLHPPESVYVNIHSGVLHLWKPQTKGKSVV